MTVMVRVEKFKNLQNKACLLPFLHYLLYPGILSTAKKSGNHHQSTQNTTNNEGKEVSKLYFANS